MKTDIVFVCTECGKQMLKWMGRCPGCGEWHTVVEREIARSKGGGVGSLEKRTGNVVPLTEIQGDTVPRMKTGIQELDRVLGGGMVRRSVILLGGDPGIGKSTLLMQALGVMAARGETVLYVSGEESLEQLKLRAERLDVKSPEFLILVENELEPIMEKMGDVQASVVVIDSVQSICSRSSDSLPGSVTQVRHVAGTVLDRVKRGSAACFIVGHVTKDGVLAGPKVLEHMVDTVLYFEGERGHAYRILRGVKNRFGSATEIGVFEMGDRGLAEVSNPSELFLSERPQGVSGSAVTALVEGTRPILAEIQALVTGPIPGQGRRTCLGTDSQRLALMIAVIEKKLGLALGDQDIFLNAVGGVRAVEPASDLAVAAALLSSFLERSITGGTLVFGEVGLAGEVRRVSKSEARINEASRLGFNRIIAPAANVEPVPATSGIKVVGVSHIEELSGLLFDSDGSAEIKTKR
ncbi:MAG: DNA repair protein RadA [Desulfomonilaceae bacterium]|nr:DNA repair protein RadA [Desulfomonilaceae bacterium]